MNSATPADESVNWIDESASDWSLTPKKTEPSVAKPSFTLTLTTMWSPARPEAVSATAEAAWAGVASNGRATNAVAEAVMATNSARSRVETSMWAPHDSAAGSQ